MNGLELKLPSRTLMVNLETYIDAFPRRYFDENDQDYVVYKDETPKIEYLNYYSMGLSFLFEAICLKAVFMYIRGDGYSKFQNSCTYLTDTFWNNPSQDIFEEILRGYGFEKSRKENKVFSVMYKDDIYFSYMARPDSSHVTFGRRLVTT